MTFETIENWALHAFADGELEGEERKEIEKLLSENEAARKALSAITYQKAELHKAYDGVLGEAVPPSLITAALAKQPRRILPYLAAASALVPRNVYCA